MNNPLYWIVEKGDTAIHPWQLHERPLVEIWDVGQQVADRYTVIIIDVVFGMSEDALSPGGFNQYCGELKDLPGARHGRRIDFDEAPLDVQTSILRRIDGFPDRLRKKIRRYLGVEKWQMR